jgi:hypothetical protein
MDRYTQKNGPRVFQLQKAISVVAQENSSVSCYFTKIKTLWEELNNYRPISICSCCHCGRMKSILELYSQERVLQFLMGLNDSFSAVRAQILLMDPLPSINKVFSLIIQEEKQREICVNPISHDTSSAMMTKSFLPKHSTTTHHEPAVYMSKPSPRPKSFKQPYKKDRPMCSHCGVAGHTVEKCYRVHGFPPGFKFTQNRPVPHSANQVQMQGNDLSGPHSQGTNLSGPHYQGTDLSGHQSHASQLSSPQLSMISAQCQQLMNLLNQHQIPHPSSSTTVGNSGILNPKHSVFSAYVNIASHTNLKNHTWIIDTGATDHMISCSSMFTTITAIVSTHVKLPNGSIANVTHIGTVTISETLTLTGVLCVPSFTFNLISATKLIKSLNCCLIFLAGYCFIQSLHNWRTIGVGEEVAGLFYLMQANKVSTNASISAPSIPSFFKHLSFNSIKDPSCNLWHYRLGHPSHSRIKLIQTIVPSISCIQESVCSICHLAKQRKLPFPISNSFSTSIFELLHCDVWGPMAINSINGSRFFLTIVDDYSRFTWVHLMQHKSQTSSIIQSFSNMVQTQFHTKIKCIRSDNGTEFHMRDFFSAQGIIHQLSCVETPQQNSVVERKHQHLLNVARSLRFQSNLPLPFWADCVLTAAHIINRIPTPLLSNKSPH